MPQRRYPPPTKRERADMESFALGIHCLREEHDVCGGSFVRDLASEKWDTCTCFCHRDRPDARRRRSIYTPT